MVNRSILNRENKKYWAKNTITRLNYTISAQIELTKITSQKCYDTVSMAFYNTNTILLNFKIVQIDVIHNI